MSLRDITRAIIAEVERLSGYPVLVTEDRSLRTLASLYSSTSIVLRYAASASELDFIPSTGLSTGINYDIKYRLGQDGAEEAEE